jgi:hypothetical protein
VRRGILDDIPVRDERRLDVTLKGAAHVRDVDPVLNSADTLDLGDAMGCGAIPLQTGRAPSAGTVTEVAADDTDGSRTG